MRKSTAFLVLVGGLAAAVVVVAWRHGPRGRAPLPSELRAGTALVRRLALTDFALWTEARYTRHPSQADSFSPFQDFPSSLEHFPAGSMLAPPARGRR